MTTTRETGDSAGNAFRLTGGPKHLAEREQGRLGKGLRMTLPFVVASAMTVTFNLTGPVDPANATPKRPAKPKADFSGSLRGLIASAKAVAAAPASTPSTYTVAAGDTISSIAGRFGLSTASVLALNGLGWKSLIFPGQVLKLSAAAVAAPAPAPAPAPVEQINRYTIQKGDTISRIAARFGVSTQAVLSANGLGWTSIIYPGQSLNIPGASAPVIETVSAVTPAPPAASGSYVIKKGDTISAIASRHGVSTRAVLDANGLSASSIIYPGRSLVIPAAGGTMTAGGIAPLTDEMAANARIIIEVGRALGISDRGIVIALATAMQESTLRNLNWGDRDSLGLFQQRPSTGWGSPAQIMDVRHATRLFFDGNAGYTRGLRDIAGWESMPLTVAAQKVQVSAFPDAYAKWESSAVAWLDLLT